MKTSIPLSRVTTTAMMVGVLFAGHATAQNDDVGIGKTGEGEAPVDTTDESSAMSAGILTLTGSVEDGWLDERLAAVSIMPSQSDAPLFIELIDGDDVMTPMVSSIGDATTQLEIVDESLAEVQGHADLAIPMGLDVTMRKPAEAAAGLAVLLVHQYTAGADDTLENVPLLSDVLTDGAGASQVILMGDLTEVDVRKFQRLVEKHESQMPGLVATWVFVSLDDAGDQHISGLRVASDGSLLEVLTQ